jgi:predicted GIY-YIG superfamily endonuclease
LENNKIYIGQTSNLDRRWFQYKYASKFETKYLINRAMKKYGFDKFVMEKIAECPNRDEANKLEYEFIEQYKSSISSIEFVDPNVNYDKFCDNNKINDKRKALTTFIVNLMKKDLLAKSQISYLILHLIDIVFKNIDVENKNYEIEEITENIFIFITLSISDLKDHDTWESIYSKIKNLSQCKAKENLRISSRSIFKYMDILDQIKKET